MSDFKQSPPIAERFFTEIGVHEITGQYENMDEDDGVDNPCDAYDNRVEEWRITDNVMGGILAMRAAGEEYLPMEPKEDKGSYHRRLKRTKFAPLYRRLRDSAVAQLLRRPIVVQGELSQTIKEHLENIDLQNNDLNSWARTLVQEGIDKGGVAVMVEFPKVIDAENKTRADVVSLNLRPYWVTLKAEEIIAADYEIIGGNRVLTELRLKRTVDRKAENSKFKRVQVEQVIRYIADGFTSCAWEIYEKEQTKKSESSKYELTNSGVLQLKYIPVVPLIDFFVRPPMIDIVHLNVAHYYAWNRLDNALSVAGNPRLILFGYNPAPGQELGGVDEALIFDNPNGRAEWIVAASIDFAALEREVERIESTTKELAISAMHGQKNVAESGMSKQMDRVHSDSMLAMFAQSLQDTIDACLRIHCEYTGDTVPTCQVNRSFQLSRLSYEDVKILSAMAQVGQLSNRMLLTVLIAGEWLPEETDIDEILEEINGTETEMETEDPEIDDTGELDQSV